MSLHHDPLVEFVGEIVAIPSVFLVILGHGNKPVQRLAVDRVSWRARCWAARASRSGFHVCIGPGAPCLFSRLLLLLDFGRHSHVSRRQYQSFLLGGTSTAEDLGTALTFVASFKLPQTLIARRANGVEVLVRVRRKEPGRAEVAEVSVALEAAHVLCSRQQVKSVIKLRRDKRCSPWSSAWASCSMGKGRYSSG